MSGLPTRCACCLGRVPLDARQGYVVHRRWRTPMLVCADCSTLTLDEIWRHLGGPEVSPLAANTNGRGPPTNKSDD